MSYLTTDFQNRPRGQRSLIACKPDLLFGLPYHCLTTTALVPYRLRLNLILPWVRLNYLPVAPDVVAVVALADRRQAIEVIWSAFLP